MDTLNKTKSYVYFIGIDISKETLDIAVMVRRSILVHNTISNEPKAIKDHMVNLKASLKFTTRNAVVGMEDTGIYGNHLINKLKTLKIDTVVDSPLRVKNSLGLIRGKTDKKDAERIALYLYKSRDILRLRVPKRPIIEQLAGLSTLRKRLQSLHIAMRVPLKENTGFVKKGLIEQNNRLCSRSIDALRLDIQDVEDSIEATWKADEETNRLMTLIQSVPCVGPVVALEILICTNEFKNVRTIKQFASYAGVAPFPYKSGTTVSKKTRTSKIANKKMKALLHCSAVLAKRFIPDIKAYYHRKMDIEGKHKMSVLNAIRLKIAARVYSCVKNNRLYEKKHEYRPTTDLDLPT
ncbi:transposase [Pedobacter kyonggii]|uniref:IS110 family transposase n=1 Tax=Pedobacter kyonggii TaxID=1926871 RepID=A0A4Q9H9E3_9SPHI|nr:transposase [Pedobacter kyonggii]TBO40585.1 IS110 family transposase [Pedobacter kyonggii]